MQESQVESQVVSHVADNKVTNSVVASKQIKSNLNNEETIDLVDVFYLLLDNIWKIVICMVVGALLAFGITKIFIKPTYQATSKIYVVSASNNSVINLSDLQVGSQLTSDYQELLLARPVLQDVIKNLNLSYDYKELEKMISISNTSGTRILNIDVTTTNAQTSADIANELVKQATVYLPQVMETEAPNLVESAVAPSKKSAPSYSKNTLIGALIGAVLMCGILIVKYLMNDTVITAEDVEKYFGTMPLGAIPEGSSNGRRRKKGAE